MMLICAVGAYERFFHLALLLSCLGVSKFGGAVKHVLRPDATNIQLMYLWGEGARSVCHETAVQFSLFLFIPSQFLWTFEYVHRVFFVSLHNPSFAPLMLCIYICHLSYPYLPHVFISETFSTSLGQGL